MTSFEIVEKAEKKMVLRFLSACKCLILLQVSMLKIPHLGFFDSPFSNLH
jgi:hypothetical protein